VRGGTYAPAASEGVLATHKVLRNTYLLLSMTLLFSAGMAAVSMTTGAPALPWWMNLVGMLGLLFLVQATRNSAWGLLAVFAFTGFVGFMTGPVISAYLTRVPNGAQLVAMSMGGTGVIFAGLSAYALISKKDFSYMGGFLLAGMLIILIAGIANIWLGMTGLSLAISVAAIGIFSALILFDTSRIIHGGETNYISATVSLYLNIYNIFISLLNLAGITSSDD
jgi:modulator of FtsH protease